MATDKPVSLSSCGKNWAAFYYDSTGKRRCKCRGSKSNLSKRQARVLRDRFAADLRVRPALARGADGRRLVDHLERYILNRMDLKESTRKLHDMIRRYLLEYFGPDACIDKITRADARDWRAALARGNLENARTNPQFRGKKNSNGSICQHVRNAKTMFNHAVVDDLVLYNPFDKLLGKASEPDKDWRCVSLDEFSIVLDACPNIGWRVFLALCRLAGLCRGR